MKQLGLYSAPAKRLADANSTQNLALCYKCLRQRQRQSDIYGKCSPTLKIKFLNCYNTANYKLVRSRFQRGQTDFLICPDNTNLVTALLKFVVNILKETLRSSVFQINPQLTTNLHNCVLSYLLYCVQAKIIF